jgi:DNA-binding CsgD family transcriptional regulator
MKKVETIEIPGKFFSLKQKFSLEEFEEILPLPDETLEEIIFSAENHHLIDPEHFLPVAIHRQWEKLRMIRNSRQKHFHLLTSREKEIVGLIAAGKNNPCIAKILNISRRTVEQHRKNIRKKLDFPTDFELFMFARAFGLS